MGEYVPLNDLFVYKLSVELSDQGWKIYESLDWKDRKIMGDQFIESTDSNGANIAEGYGRYHFLDRIKFCYNARGSLLEAKHWASLLYKRNKITKDSFDAFLKKTDQIHYNLNQFIQSLYKSKTQV
ncbi:MAG: four helix bundle protein [Candidatus Pacebacteria bacterium]|nr:four helix bundle protein [Candidatus Paceibacterota bacterium]